MKVRKIFWFLWLAVSFCNAQQVQPSSSEILQQLKKLNTVGSVLYVAAHPDDENTRLLSYLSKEKNLRTGYLSITRGDGGQNLVGKEQGDLLGLIRTNELLAARKVDGAEQFFTRANDFGFSKNPEETFSFWNKDSILRDVVWVIRNFKPDVIICRFPTTGEGGHGHHTASAILALEAFDAAADPKKYPEQFAYTSPWQTKRLFWNTFNFSSGNTTAADQIQVDVGVYNPLLGKSYGEISAESRSNHKSQGFGSAKQRGKMIEYFKQLKGDSVKTLFEGIDQTWKRINGGAEIEKLIDACIKNYDVQAPEKSINELIVIYRRIQSLHGSTMLTMTSTNVTLNEVEGWKKQKIKETEDLIIACSGFWIEAYPADYIGIPGREITLTVQAVNRSNSSVKLNKINYLNRTDTIVNSTLTQNELVTYKHIDTLPANTPFSNPYWLNEKHPVGIYSVSNRLLIGKPVNDPLAVVTIDLEINGLPLKLEQPIIYKYTDPVKGEIYRLFEILPPATVNISENVFMFGDKKAKSIQFTVKANAPKIAGNINVEVSSGWKLQIDKKDFKLSEKGEEVEISAMLMPPAGNAEGQLKASLHLENGKIFNKSIIRIEHDHIPYQFILSDAEAKLVSFDLKKSGLNIGYIPGAGDAIPACLKQVGYHVSILEDENLSNDDLSVYDAIITGVRAYNTNDHLSSYYNKLMEYVKNGGNMVVQYNTSNNIGPVVAKIAPYPFKITRDRVTNEKAEVRMLNPELSVLNYPNKITQKDFEGWIQERGIYFAGERDSTYTSVLSMNDANDKPLDGSLIIAKYGKGNFAYTGLVFFRELPAGVPGAYRLLANLLGMTK